MFQIISNSTGSRDALIVENYPITAAKVVAKGALVYNDASNGTVELVGADFGTNLLKYPLGITLKASTASTTFTTMPIALIGPDTVMEADVSEILNATELTATGGGVTTFVDSSITGAANDELIGAVVQVVLMASGDKATGTLLTVTDYVAATGTLTFNSLGSTGFAAGDKIKIIKLGKNILSSISLNVGAASNAIVLDGASATVATPSFRVVGLSDDQKKVHVRIAI